VPKLADQLLPAIHAELKAAREAAERAKPTPLDLLHDLEIILHHHIRQRLEEKYGPTEEGWWVEGVPLAIRQECHERREADPSRDEPFAYTYLIDLKAIIDKNWTLFESDMKQLGERRESVSKKDISECLQSANEIRNRYAHPVRAPRRGTPEFDADLQAAQRALELIRGLTTQEIQDGSEGLSLSERIKKAVREHMKRNEDN
jgi:hypothetical protein